MYGLGWRGGGRRGGGGGLVPSWKKKAAQKWFSCCASGCFKCTALNKLGSMHGQIYEEHLMRFSSERNVRLLAKMKCQCEITLWVVTLEYMICLWSSKYKYCWLLIIFTGASARFSLQIPGLYLNTVNVNIHKQTGGLHEAWWHCNELESPSKTSTERLQVRCCPLVAKFITGRGNQSSRETEM